MGEEDKKKGKYQKSYFDVLGICCTSEVPLIEKILKPLNGVHKVSVVVPSKTVIVVHDNLLISQHEIVKALNQARLEATIRAYGSAKLAKKWPSPYILACGVLLVVSLFKHFFHPLRWFAVAAVLVGIKPIIFRGIAAVRKLTLDINILMLIAVGGAIALADYSEAAFIVFLFTIAEWLESRASHKATAGMSSLMSMAPQKAVLAETGQVVDVEEVEINTIIAVKAGELIPIDGIVVDGQSEVDERSLTGESFPVTKQANSLVWAGTLNIDGYITVRTTALSENSAVAKMTRLVEEAQNSRSSTQRLIDSCTRYYTPAVVVIAAAVALVPLLMRVRKPRRWFQLALVLLVSACPCSLVLSTPVATFCALLKAARIGLLIKGGDVLEALAKTKVVAFDKTGTITRGEFSIVEFQSLGSKVTVNELIYWVSSIESKSSHPMAAAFVQHARSYSIEPKPECVKEFHIYPGEGIHGEIEGRNVYVGNKRIAARASCDTVPDTKNIREGVTFGYVFLDTVAIGTYTLADTCRRGAAEAMKELKLLGIKTAMLTGDSTEAAVHAQRQLNHDIEVHAELLPEDKVKLIGDLKSREGHTAMVGDGMNDAPALALANVGISMGISGSAVATETGHITLMSNDIGKIPKAIRLARKTRFKIIGNIIFSVVTKIAIMSIAFAGYPLLWAAVLADVGTCLVVILNSMMLLQTKTSSKEKCCGSSHKKIMGKPKHTEHCGTGVCGQQNILRCRGKHDCHDHGNDKYERMHDHCMNQHHQEESPNHTLQCQNKHKCCDHKKAKDEKKHDHCMSHDHQSELLHSHHSLQCQDQHGCHVQKKDENLHDHCTNRDHHAESPSQSHYKSRCQNKHVCHNHKEDKDDKVQDHYMNHAHPAESKDHSHYCQESTTNAIGSTQEHLISITEFKHNSGGFQEQSCCTSVTCSQKPDSVKDGHDRKMTCENRTNQKSDGSCMTTENNCGTGKDCLSSHKNDGCFLTNKYEYEKEKECSSSQGILGRREPGGCCRSYRKACAKKHSCCSSGSIQLPEIITE
ncbi:inactive cadmium/zinc-transporting ATPase HMA3 isoform X1 [Canna indica]|uniref:Inactive cadmium/zinc-transporting ATPase HMA3 isoform X1 n=1 Tax=Canna indica TaxID=4628 RepID=A0AAQ3QQ09_9LILI|nr:inactive cadmium/zinc-transporting ATPase HMA3 isoform X1 [Canna indica]